MTKKNKLYNLIGDRQKDKDRKPTKTVTDYFREWCEEPKEKSPILYDAFKAGYLLGVGRKR